MKAQTRMYAKHSVLFYYQTTANRAVLPAHTNSFVPLFKYRTSKNTGKKHVKTQYTIFVEYRLETYPDNMHTV